MSLRSSRFRNWVCALGAALGAFACEARAWGQACCAGSNAATPGRLAAHEDAAVGVQVKASAMFGSFDANGSYASSPPHVSEYDFEQDLFGAVRLFSRLQLALLVPINETRRATPTITELGGGIGDVNASARYDFLLAGQSKYVPGIALLAGITFPTGTAPESASKPLATDATGIGAYQGNVGLALEQTFGPWLVGLSGIVAKRTARDVNGIHSTLGTQITGLAVGGYTFESGVALALIGAYQAEGDATVAGLDAPGTARRIVTLSFAGLMPIGESWRVQAALFTNPPILGENLPALTGLSATIVRTW